MDQVFFACCDWLLKLGISSVIRLQTKLNSPKLNVSKIASRFAGVSNIAVLEKHKEGEEIWLGSFNR